MGERERPFNERLAQVLLMWGRGEGPRAPGCRCLLERTETSTSYPPFPA